MDRRSAIFQLLLMPSILVAESQKRLKLKKGDQIGSFNFRAISNAEEIVMISIHDDGEVMPNCSIEYHIDKIDITVYFKGQKKQITGQDIWDAI